MNYVIFNADGSLNKQSFEYYVQQGDSNNQFFVGLSGGLASDSAVGVCVLPNGSTRVISGVWNANYEYAEGETADGWLFSLTTQETEYSGLLQVALYVSRGSTIKVSYPIGIIVNETGVRPDTDTGITIEELNSYLVELQKYALKDHVIYLEDRLSTDTLSLIGTGPHFVRVGGVYYFITISGSGTVDFSAINLSNPKMYYHGSVSDSTTLATALSSTYLDELVDLTSEQTITGKKTLENTGNVVPATGSTYEVGSSSKPYGNVHTDSVNSIPVNSFENKNNKVVAINASSTDTQYPSAKCVYDNIQDTREIAAGKSANYSLSYSASTPNPMSFSSYYYIDSDGDLQKFASYDEMTTYMTGLTMKNSDLNSQSDMVSFVVPYFSGYYLLMQDNQGRSIVAKLSDIYKLVKVGDNILITETEVPDRWVQTANAGYFHLYKLETAKMSNYYTKSESLLPTSSGTYNIGGNGALWHDINIDGKIDFGDSNYISNYSGTTDLAFAINNRVVLRLQEYALYSWGGIRPGNNDTYSLGDSDSKWKYLYLSGIIYLGATTQIKNDANGNFEISNNNGLLKTNTHIRPTSNNSVSLGANGLSWQNIWVNNIKGAATLTQAQYDALVSGGTVDSDTFYFIEEE